jgi:CubicO group peptidase (beta-lactamase class C family)
VSTRSGIPGLLNILTHPDDYVAHVCQFLPTGTLLECAETIYTTPLSNLASKKPNTVFDYGGSQWQLAGGVAELVGGGTWQQLWDQYIAEPCDLQIARFGNNLSFAGSWDGNLAGLVGLENPNMEGGMMSDLDDYAKLISLHLNDGICGGQQVLSSEAVAFMRKDRSPEIGYGMGWWIKTPKLGGSTYLYDDPGLYGSIAWLDTERGYGGVVFFEEYSGISGGIGSGGVSSQLIPIIEEALDAVR